MARTNTATKSEVQAAPAEEKVKGGALVAAPGSNVAVVDNSMFAEDAGTGMEGADRDSFAIPFLMVLQKGSPQVDETHAAYSPVEGAKAGAFFDNVSNKVYEGKERGVLIVPCAFRRTFIRWGSEASGEGYKGEFTAEEVEAMKARGQVKELDNRLYFPLDDGSVNEKRCDRISDTRNHYILLIDEEGDAREALLSLSSTQIKKSKTLMAALANVRLDGPAGKFTPATYANLVRVTTIPESNDKGSWYGVRFQLEGQVTNPRIYAAAKNFHKKVVSGAVVAKYEAPASAEAGGGADGF